MLTEHDLADVLKVDARQVASWRRRYAWPHVRVGRTVRFTSDQVAWIVRLHTCNPAAPAAGALPGQTCLSVARHSR